MNNFTKPPKTIDQLYDILIERWLKVNNKNSNFIINFFSKNNTEKEIKKDLKHIWYFRLTWYLKYFQDDNNNFYDWITFKKVLDHYIFDRKLRLLTFDAIEKIEISVKSSMNHYMTINFWIHWYLNESLFQLTNEKKIDMYKKFIKKVEKINEKPNSVFVKSYFEKYTSEKYLPSWMLIEELTIWEISTVYNLLKTSHRISISKVYNTYEKDFWIWLQLLNTLRNISAHHWRLWNKKYITKLKIEDVTFKKYFQTKPNIDWKNEVIPNYYNAILVIYYLLNKINKNFWRLNDLNKLILKYKNIVNISNMWLTTNWKNEIEIIIKFKINYANNWPKIKNR